jgi:hypothetical protein
MHIEAPGHRQCWAPVRFQPPVLSADAVLRHRGHCVALVAGRPDNATPSHLLQCMLAAAGCQKSMPPSTASQGL